MIFIDWQSAKDHASFNRSFFAALGLPKSLLYVFSEALCLSDQESVLAPRGGRFRQALNVARICWKHRRESIFLLTYDPVLIPLIQFVCKRLFVFEHNTTPEHSGWLKHSIWQWLFYFRIERLAQYPNQVDVLSKLRQQCYFLGSPLQHSEKPLRRDEPSVFLAASWRLKVSELLKIKPFVGNRQIVIKRGSLSESELELLRRELNIVPLDWIDLDEYLPKTIAVIVTISSRTRGSGWFNEAIKFGLPIVITSDDVEDLFKRTFPGYPYVRSSSVSSATELAGKLQEISRFPSDEYIDKYNHEFRQRFRQITGE